MIGRNVIRSILWIPVLCCSLFISEAYATHWDDELFTRRLLSNPIDDFIARLLNGTADPAAERVNQLKLALYQAPQTPEVCGQTRCNFFAARVAEILGIPYLRDVNYNSQGLDPNGRGGNKVDRSAATIHQWLVQAAAPTTVPAIGPSSSGWRSLGQAKHGEQLNQAAFNEAQQLADQGFFVVLSAPRHIALVVPSAMPKDPDLVAGKGPWIRDAQHPTASVPANKGGNSSRWGLSNAEFFVYEQQPQNRVYLDSKTGSIVASPRLPQLSTGSELAVLPSLVPDKRNRQEYLSAFAKPALANEWSKRQVPPPPPPPGGGRTPSQLGGVDLGVTSLVTKGNASGITGVVLDSVSQRVILLKHEAQETRVSDLTPSDLAMALWLVYQEGVPAPAFSLDPADPRNPSGPWLKAVYYPERLRGYSFGYTLFAADFLLKQYAFGVQVADDGTVQEHHPKTGLASISQLMAQDGRLSRQPQWARLWIVPEAVAVRQDDGVLVFESVQMAVRARRQIPDARSPTGLRDIDTEEDCPEVRFARQFTADYEELAREAPEFARIRELAKAMALAKWLKHAQVPIDFERVAQVLNADSARAVDRISTLEVAWNQEERKALATRKGPGAQIIRRQIRLSGGVDLSVKLNVLNDDGSTQALRRTVVAQLASESTRSVFIVEHRNQRFVAEVLPFTANPAKSR